MIDSIDRTQRNAATAVVAAMTLNFFAILNLVIGPAYPHAVPEATCR